MSKRSLGQSPSESDEESAGLSMSDVLAQPEPLRGLLTWMMREDQVEFPAIVAFLQQDETAVRPLLADWVKRGYVQQVSREDKVYYAVRLAPQRKRQSPGELWDHLDGKSEK